MLFEVHTSHRHSVYSVAITVRQCGISYKSVSLIQHNINLLKCDFVPQPVKVSFFLFFFSIKQFKLEAGPKLDMSMYVCM